MDQMVADTRPGSSSPQCCDPVVTADRSDVLEHVAAAPFGLSVLMLLLSPPVIAWAGRIFLDGARRARCAPTLT
jgi:hypothetical protein